MPRYIDADKLKSLFLKNYSVLTDIIREQNDYGAIMGISALIGNTIANTPTADVQEVIYCKNCKNYYKFENGDVVCEEFGGYIKDNDFCSRGERKDGKE